MMEGTGVTNGDIVHSCDALQKPQDQDVPVSPNDNISPVVPLNPPNAQTSTTNLQFVCVASCHSEKVAQIFMKIGVRHVICINQN